MSAEEIISGPGTNSYRSKLSQRIGNPSGVFLSEQVAEVHELQRREGSDLTAIVARARRGDVEAFADLVAVHQRMVHRVAFRMTGSEAESADLAQETFLRAWSSLEQLRDDTGFGSWLYRITVSTCLNAIRARRRRERIHEEFSATLSQGESEAESWICRRVLAALDQLNPDLRAAVVLTVYEGLNHAQASTILGCAETTVSWRVWRARTQLKRLLAELRPRESSTP